MEPSAPAATCAAEAEAEAEAAVGAEGGGSSQHADRRAASASSGEAVVSRHSLQRAPITSGSCCRPWR